MHRLSILCSFLFLVIIAPAQVNNVLYDGFMGFDIEFYEDTLRIRNVLTGSPADTAGLKARDIILEDWRKDFEQVDDILVMGIRIFTTR